MVDAAGTTNYSYSPLGQLASVTDGGGATLGYDYDSRGRITTLTYPGGDEVDYGYDDTGLMTSVTDWLGNESEFAWTADGQLASEALGNGISGEYAYDDAGRSTAIDYAMGATPLASYEYDYDAAGQLTGFTLDDPLNTADEREFGYDLRGQIATVAGAGGYSISAAGLVTATPEGAALSYNAKLELTSVADAAASTTFTFDGNGSRLTQERTPAIGAVASTSYEYDAANSLASVELPSGTNVGYTSDGDGLRQSRTVDSSTQAFVWNVNAAIALLLDDGEHRYVYGPTSTPIAQYDASDDVEYLLADQLGSVRVITDAVGAIVGSASFGVFGAVEAASGVTSAFGFTGAWTDDETGLVYLRARDYDPATGQFLQVDPAVDDTRQPYAYAYNNPLLWTDPTGLDVWGDIGEGVGGFLAGALDDLTFGASSAILGALIPGYDCWTQTNPWFAVGQTVAMVVSTAALLISGVGAAVAIAKIVATVGVKGAVKLAAGAIKNSVRNTLQSVKSALAAGGGGALVIKAAASSRVVERFGPMNRGPLADDVADTFRSGTYDEVVSSAPTTVWRVHGGDREVGSYWSKDRPTGPTQAILDSALDPTWGNNATHWVMAQLPPGTRFFEGVAAAQGGILGGGNQIFLPRIDLSWVVGRGVF